MKGRLKDRVKQITLIVLFLIISVLTISLIAGRINTQDILILKKDGVDTNVPLDQQLEFFEHKKILKSEMKYFQGTVVTNVNQLKDKTLLYSLKAGSPIPVAALIEPTGAGQFAAVMPKGRTVHFLASATGNLPPVQEGDKINIALTYKQKSDDENQSADSIRTGMLMTNVKIYKIVESGIYVDVSLEQDLVLSTAAQLGTFIYQIPGQKSELCSSSDCSNTNTTPDVVHQSDIFQAILDKTYASDSSDSTSTEESSSVNEKTSKSQDNAELDDVAGSDNTSSDSDKADNSTSNEEVDNTGGADDGQQEN